MSENAVYQRPRTPIIVWLIVGAIGLAYAAFTLANPEQQQAADWAFALIPERFDPASSYRFNQWWEAAGPIFGHSLLHVAWWHAAMNAFFFFLTARLPALRLGDLRFFLVFLAGAAGGALAFVGLNWGEQQIAVGASAAVCGVFSAYFLSVRPSWRESMADPRVRNPLAMIFILNVVVMGVVAEMGWFPIAWEGHLGGFIGGALAYVLLAPKRQRGPWG